MENYSHLIEKDRWKFYQLHQSGISMAEIARRLGKHRSTLYRELARNKRKEDYQPGQANQMAKARQGQEGLCKIARYETLRRYIYQKLKLGWSPEQIAGRLKRKKSKFAICHETIYRYIYQHPNKKLFKHLKYKKRKRYRRFARIKHMSHIKEKMQLLPGSLCRTITFDQGAEFAAHEKIEKELMCRVYYCHTHSPWEKGSNENMNGRLRKYLPRHADIHQLRQDELDYIADIMNATPRKCLDYKTPKELFSLQYNSVCRT
jgi:transposase, IS30 family